MAKAKKVKRYRTKIKWTSYLATAYAKGFCEGENATKDQQLDAWQYLVDNGICWQLQGWYGRMAQHPLQEGYILPPKKIIN